MKSFATAVFDFLFTVKTANVEFFDTFGSKIQRSFFAYIHEEDLPKLQQLVEDLPETHEVNHVVRIRDKNGEILLILLKLSLVHMGEEDLIEAYFIDILQTEANYNELVEKLQITRQHLTNMELVCFEYSPATKNIKIFTYSLNQAVPLMTAILPNGRWQRLTTASYPKTRKRYSTLFASILKAAKTVLCTD